MKKIGIEIDDFKKIILTDSFYIDKTKLIEEIGQDTSEVQLITRPRGFGKTLNLSMLNYFYNLENKEDNKNLFKGLYIENSPVFEEQGKYPVIFISFKDIKENTAEKMILKLTNLFKMLYDSFEYLRNSLNPSNLMDFDDICLKRDNSNLSSSLLNLCEYLHKYYNEQVILLIDEYDTPIISAYEHDYYDEIKTFFTVLFGSSLKGNPYLKKAILMGITKIDLPDVNNINVNTVLDNSFSQYFGFTSEEVESSLKEYNLENQLGEVFSWYGGYNFKATNLYNPFSVTKYLANKKIEPYWLDNLNIFFIKKVLTDAPISLYKDLVKLSHGEEVNLFVDIHTGFNQDNGYGQFFSLLLSNGYLTVKQKLGLNRYTLLIPNRDVFYSFRENMMRFISH